MSSQTPIADPTSVIWPSLTKAVRILGKVNDVPLAKVPFFPGPSARRPTRLLTNGNIILDGRSVPGPMP